MYNIEACTNRRWLVKKIAEHPYPNTFQYAVVETNALPQKQRLIISSIYAPIVGIVDASFASESGFFDKGFVREPDIEPALRNALTFRNEAHTILTPEILDLSFTSEAELTTQLSLLGVDRSEIELTLKTTRVRQFNYTLFHGGNLGYELFNHWDD